MMGIPIVDGALGMVPKDLVKELEEQEISETFQISAVLESATILIRVLET